MRATIEISLYPLQEDYKEIVKSFIRSLNEDSEIEVRTTAMSTYLTGEFEQIMDLLKNELSVVYQELPNSATVIKIIPQDLEVSKGFLNF